MKSYKFYDLILGAYVCVLLCANLIGPSKVSTIHLPVIGVSVTFMAGVLFFPVSYFFGDILTEVYGYARDRRAVWAGFGALAFASFMAAVIVHLPPADFWKDKQAAVAQIFGSTPRIAAASMIAFWCGSFVNSFVLAKMKLLTRGRWLWTRTIGSTACGELFDSGLFYVLAFAGTLTPSELLTVAATQYVLKTSWEIVSTPLTYKIVGFLKRAEQEDWYDRGTRFTPFSLEVSRPAHAAAAAAGSLEIARDAVRAEAESADSASLSR
ncbi:MAG: queuosine precursor transporter [Steroidobacteraceae bacterium]